ILQRGCAYKPGVEWIVQHRLVCSPAVRVSVFVLLNLECLVFLLQYDRNDYVSGLVVGMRLVFTGVILDVEVVSAKRFMGPDSVFGNAGSKLFTNDGNKLSFLVDGRDFIPGVVFYRECGDSVLFRGAKVVGTECR